VLVSLAAVAAFVAIGFPAIIYTTGAAARARPLASPSLPAWPPASRASSRPNARWRRCGSARARVRARRLSLLLLL